MLPTRHGRQQNPSPLLLKRGIEEGLMSVEWALLPITKKRANVRPSQHSDPVQPRREDCPVRGGLPRAVVEHPGRRAAAGGDVAAA